MPRIAADLDLLFQDLPITDRFAAVREAGFEAVVMRNPYALTLQELDRALTRNDLHLVAISTPAGDIAEGERGFMGVPRRIADFRQGFEQALIYAEALEVGVIHLMAGIAEADRAQKMLKRNLAWAAFTAPEKRLCLGPMSREEAPGYAVESLDHAQDLMDWIGAPNLGLRFDLAHALEGSGDVADIWARHASRICHVDLGGSTDARAERLLVTLQDSGYDGLISTQKTPPNRRP